MEQIPLSTRIAKVFRNKWYRYMLLTLTVIGVCLGSPGLKQLQLKAQATSTEPVEIATNSWQYASFPVENFQGYTSPFGYRLSPVDGQKQFHAGLDMAAPLGSYVRSWWTGKVVELSDNTACGTSVQIQSGEWKHIYCHLSGHVESTPKGRFLIDREGGIQLWEGQEIPVGARIARVGMTGRTTGPHLHWGLKYNGDFIDPALIIQEMFKGKA